MVKVTKGTLVECDPAMKQFLLHLDEKQELNKKFVIEILDDTHLFIDENTKIDELKEKVDELMEKFSYKATEINK